MSWTLCFQGPAAPLARIEAVLAQHFGVLTRSVDDWGGNPRDGWARAWTLRAGRAPEPEVAACCPALAQLHVGGTPLARDAAGFAALLRAFPGVRVEGGA